MMFAFEINARRPLQTIDEVLVWLADSDHPTVGGSHGWDIARRLRSFCSGAVS